MSVPTDLINSLQRGPVEISNADLFSLFDLRPDDLNDGNELKRLLAANGLVLSPEDLEPGGVYHLSSPLLEAAYTANPQMELYSDETDDKEYKQTLHFDVRRSQNDPTATKHDLKNPKMLFAVLKTICAFVNSDGGTLWIGVDDDGKPTDGLLRDCELFGRDSVDCDFFENHLRNLVSTSFDQGTMINDLLRMTFHDIDGCTALQIRVSQSRRLVTFGASCGENHRVAFRRQGNRSTELTLPEVQDYLEQRS